MLRSVAIIFALAGALSPLSANEMGPPLPDYSADKVAKATFVIHGPMDEPNVENQGFMNNPAWVQTPGGVVVVDPGSSLQVGEMVLRQIRKQTDAPVIAVLNTHVHGDHWLGNHAFRNAAPEVAIYGHPNMIAAVERGVGLTWRDNMLRYTDGATAGTEVFGPNLEVNDGDVVELGGYTFKFHYMGSAHTDNDVMIEVVEESLLFTGDNATNGRIIRMDDGKFNGNVATLEKADETIAVDVVVPGHGKTGGREVLTGYATFLGTLYAKVAELRDEGMSDFEMKDQVKAALPAYHEWNGFDSSLGKLISLAFLEAEALEFE